jgi:hypothetical protein
MEIPFSSSGFGCSSPQNIDDEEEAGERDQIVNQQQETEEG